MLPLHGFTLLRNGLKYDYPFRESLGGLRALCDSVTLALGASDDGTEAAVAGLGLEIVPTVWDEAKRQGGVILSEQTNVALGAVRKKVPRGWGFYLQADEAISERDFALIRRDLELAEAEGCDAISFRYLHFWQSYEAIAIGKRWYPQEIRCVRLDSKIESYGDAQSFRDFHKRFESEAVIYHYGHVREAAAYERKKNDFHRWWHPDSEIASVIAKGSSQDRKEPNLRYLGPHPANMSARIGKAVPPPRAVAVLGDRSVYASEFLARVNGELAWLDDDMKALENRPEDVILLRALSPLPYVLGMGRYKSKVPARMASPQARDWTPEFQALLRFSEKGIAISS